LEKKDYEKNIKYRYQRRHRRGARAKARLDYQCGTPPPLLPLHSILRNQGKTEVLPVLSPTAPL
jgi:hypothetical protein